MKEKEKFRGDVRGRLEDGIRERKRGFLTRRNWLVSVYGCTCDRNTLSTMVKGRRGGYSRT